MRVLLTGASGQLGGYLLRQLRSAGDTVTAWSGTSRADSTGSPLIPVDIANGKVFADAFRQARPQLVIHTAAMARVGECSQNPERARQVNTEGSATLARLAAEVGSRLVHVSTDLVFDGEKGNYREEDVAEPLSVYGRTKRHAETAVLAYPGHLVVRVSLMFGPSVVGRPSFFDEQVKALRAGRPVHLFTDEWRTPLSLRTAAEALVVLAKSELGGVIHVGGPERLSRWEMGLRLATHLGADPALVVAGRREQLAATEPRPRDTSLDSSRWRGLFPDVRRPGYDKALRELLPPNSPALQ
jgi:dTDP-4-dehydrorhamnose reductase